MTNLRVLVADVQTKAATAELVAVNTVRTTDTLNRPGSWAITIGLDQPATITKAVLEMPRAAILIEADDILVAGGRLDTQDYDFAARTITLTGQSFGAYLYRRRLRINKDYANTEQTAIVWDLINYTQSQLNGNIGIVNQATVTPVNRTLERIWAYERRNIGTLIEQLTARQGWFDYELKPQWAAGPNSTYQVAYTTVYPATGRPTGLVLEGGSNCHVNGATRDSRNLAYVIDAVGQGTGELTPIVTVADTSAITAGIMLEDSENLSDIIGTDSLRGHAEARLHRGSTPVVLPRVRLDPAQWTGVFSLGDRTTFKASAGPFDENGLYRVVQMETTYAAQGPSTIDATLSPLALFI